MNDHKDFDSVCIKHIQICYKFIDKRLDTLTPEQREKLQYLYIESWELMNKVKENGKTL